MLDSTVNLLSRTYCLLPSYNNMLEFLSRLIVHNMDSNFIEFYA